MNTLAHIAALAGVMWLALYCFNTLDEVGLGIAVILGWCLILVLTLLAAKEDLDIMFGGRERE